MNNLVDKAAALRRLASVETSALYSQRRTLLDAASALEAAHVAECAKQPAEAEGPLAEMNRIRATMAPERAAQGDYEDLATYAKEVVRLREENHGFRTWGIIEVAARNPSVAEYIDHWESRVAKLERAVAKARDQRDYWRGRDEAGLEIEAELRTEIEQLGRPMETSRTAINKRFQELYEAGMREGKHGHWETLFHAMHEAYATVGPSADTRLRQERAFLESKRGPIVEVVRNDRQPAPAEDINRLHFGSVVRNGDGPIYGPGQV